MQFTVEHIGLPARDTVALKDWYSRMLNAEVIYTDGQTPPAFILRLPGDTLIEIYKANSSITQTCDNKLAGWRHLALRVPSIDAAKAELEQRGIVFTDQIKPAMGGGRVLFFTDLEGNLLHLVERPQGCELDKRV